MKTRKALAVLLALVMLVVPLVVSSYAAPAASIVTSADVIAYTDTEYFNPQGLVINDGSVDVVYTPANKDFSFVPALNEPLSAETTEINVFYKNVACGTIAITVTHTLTGKLEHIGNGHGEYCLGCGQLGHKSTLNDAQSLADFQRLEIAVLLDQGYNYVKISEAVGVSAATITRVNRALNYGADGYRMALDRINEEERPNDD